MALLSAPGLVGNGGECVCAVGNEKVGDGLTMRNFNRRRARINVFNAQRRASATGCHSGAHREGEGTTVRRGGAHMTPPRALKARAIPTPSCPTQHPHDRASCFGASTHSPFAPTTIAAAVSLSGCGLFAPQQRHTRCVHRARCVLVVCKAGRQRLGRSRAPRRRWLARHARS